MFTMSDVRARMEQIEMNEKLLKYSQKYKNISIDEFDHHDHHHHVVFIIIALIVYNHRQEQLRLRITLVLFVSKSSSSQSSPWSSLSSSSSIYWASSIASDYQFDNNNNYTILRPRMKKIIFKHLVFFFCIFLF